MMNPMMGSMTFPWGGGKLQGQPNPLSQPQPIHTNKADAGGIQAALQKRGEDSPKNCLQGLVTESLNLADAFKQCHWNVKGPAFKPAHDFFGECYDELLEIADDLAERLVQLDYAAASGSSGTESLPVKFMKPSECIDLLSTRLKALITSYKTAFKTCKDDDVTINMLQDQAQLLEKKHWMLESQKENAVSQEKEAFASVVKGLGKTMAQGANYMQQNGVPALRNTQRSLAQPPQNAAQPQGDDWMSRGIRGFNNWSQNLRQNPHEKMFKRKPNPLKSPSSLPFPGGAGQPNSGLFNPYNGFNSGQVPSWANFLLGKQAAQDNKAPRLSSIVNKLALKDMPDPSVLSVAGEDGKDTPFAVRYREPRMLAKPFYNQSKELQNALTILGIMQPEVMNQDKLTDQNWSHVGLNLAARYPDRYKMLPEMEAALGEEDEPEKEAAQDNKAMRLSSCGENSGVSYKVDEEGDLTGSAAFKSLDGKMKKAGLNSFQRNFFGRLIQQGMDESMIRATVKTACDRFGDDVSSDLSEGLEKLAFGGLFRQGLKHGIPAAWNGAKQGIKSLMGYGAQQAAKAVPPAVKQAPQAIKGVAQQAGSAARQIARKPGVAARAFPGAAAQAAKAAPGQVLRGVQAAGRGAKRVATSRPVRQMGEGSLSGAFNPYTGFGSGNIWDEDGFHWDQLLKNMAGGAALSRIPGAQRMMRRGLAGEGLGWTGGYLANGLGTLTGNETLQNIDPLQLARAGYGVGAASAMPGLPMRWQNPRITRAMMRMDPHHQVLRYAGKGLKALPGAAKRNPLGAVTAAGAVATPVAAYEGLTQGLGGVQQQVALAGENTLNEVKDFRKSVEPEIQGVVDTARSVKNVADKANNFLGGGGAGGEGGGLLGGLHGLFGNLSQTMKDNPMLMLALLAGGGALGGYGLGGGGGATMGGIALPLIYLMATGQLGNMGGGQQQQQSSGSRPAVRQQSAGPNQDQAVAQLPQQPPTDEVQRQKMQQQMAMA